MAWLIYKKSSFFSYGHHLFSSQIFPLGHTADFSLDDLILVKDSTTLLTVTAAGT